MRLLVEDCVGPETERLKLLGREIGKNRKLRFTSGKYGIVMIDANAISFVGDRTRRESMSVQNENVRNSDPIQLTVGITFSIKSGDACAKLRVLELSGTDSEVDVNELIAESGESVTHVS